MKKLHSFVVCALATPILTLGAGSVLAQQSTDDNMDPDRQGTQHDRDTRKSAPGTSQGDQNAQRSWQSESQKAADRDAMHDKSGMQHRGFMAAVPANGMQASDLMGAEVITTGDEEVGSVNELIIDEQGQVVAVVVGVGGFLGMGEKRVAIGWDDVTKSGDPDELELRIDATRDELRSAPKYEDLD